MKKSLYLPLIFFALFSLSLLYGIGASQMNLSFFKKQLLWYLVGLALFLFLKKFFPFRWFENSKGAPFLIYLISIFFLVAVLFIGREIHHSKSWLSFGGINFQPVEIAKLGLIFCLAKFFSRRYLEIHRLSHLFLSGIYFLIPLGLVLAQPDLGSAIILFLIWFGLTIISGIKTKHFLTLLLIILVISIFGWHHFLKEYQKERIISFLHPEEKPLSYGYQAIQAKIALGEGGFFGKGLGKGIQIAFGFLPQAHSDFIFASLINSFGFLGGLIFFGTFFYFVSGLIKRALKARSNFEKFFILGYLIMLGAHFVIHIGANLGLLPITGIPLSFLSYGGSNLILNFIFLGIIESFFSYK